MVLPPPILTVTLNPSVDRSCHVAEVAPDRKLRCTDCRFDPGGGGINAARVIHRLGGAVTACWTRGGPVGERLHALLDAEGLPHWPVPVASDTRENLLIEEDATGEQFRFGLPGGAVTATELDRVRDVVAARTGPDGWLVCSGSLPAGVAPEAWARVAAAVPRDTRLVVDTSGPALRASLAARPYLIKPNRRELADLVGRALPDDAAVIEAAGGLVAEGLVTVVVVSLGAGGAVAVDATQAIAMQPPVVPVRSRVGAGDSMLGALVLARARGLPLVDALRLGVAAGAATVMRTGTSLCRAADVDRLRPLVAA